MTPQSGFLLLNSSKCLASTGIGHNGQSFIIKKILVRVCSEEYNQKVRDKRYDYIRCTYIVCDVFRKIFLS